MQQTRLSSSNDPTKKKKYQKEINISTKEIESLEEKLTTLQKDLNFQTLFWLSEFDSNFF